MLGGLLVRGRVLGRTGMMQRSGVRRRNRRIALRHRRRNRRIALRHQGIECRGRGSVIRGAGMLPGNCRRHHIRRWAVLRRGRWVSVVSRLSFIYRWFGGARGCLFVRARYVFARRFPPTGVGNRRRIILRRFGIGAVGRSERGDVHLCGVLQPRRSCRDVGIVETQTTAPCCAI